MTLEYAGINFTIEDHTENKMFTNAAHLRETILDTINQYVDYVYSVYGIRELEMEDIIHIAHNPNELNKEDAPYVIYANWKVDGTITSLSIPFGVYEDKRTLY